MSQNSSNAVAIHLVVHAQTVNVKQVQVAAVVPTKSAVTLAAASNKEK